MDNAFAPQSTTTLRGYLSRRGFAGLNKIVFHSVPLDQFIPQDTFRDLIHTAVAISLFALKVIGHNIEQAVVPNR